MDNLRAIEGVGDEPEYGGRDEPEMDTPPAIGTDERRMHVRAYNYWVSLLADRTYPSVEDLDPANASDFGPHSVLLDFTAGAENPGIGYLGASLRVECGLEEDIRTIAEVPSRSLLSRLTDHYLQIIANRAPIGFEAEFVSQRGRNTLYRGILMPFSSDDDTIDFIYGVINWKELADVETTAGLVLEVDRSLQDAAPSPAPNPIWADGPSADPVPTPAFEPAAELGPVPDDDGLPDAPAGDGLPDRLALAREGVELFKASDARSRAALYRALGLAYDFALAAEAAPEDYAELLRDAGLAMQARAPMTPVAKLVFGADCDKARLTEFAAVLSYARRHDLAAGALREQLERQPGGIKAIVREERVARRPAARPSMAEAARAALRRAPAQARITLPSGGDEFVLLIARREPDGSLAVLAPVPSDAALLDRAMRGIAR